MNPIEVTVEEAAGAKRVIGYACAKCKAVHRWDRMDGSWADDLDHWHVLATECCDHRCNTCGEHLGRDRGFCPTCDEARIRESLAERVEKARKVPWAEAVGAYRHGFIVDTIGRDWDEVQFDSLEDLRDNCLRFGTPDPLIVHPLRSEGIKISAAHVIESALEDHHEEAADGLLPGAREELQALLDAWCAKQRVETLMPDRDVVVVLPEGRRGE